MTEIMPNKLRVREGALEMIDGSDPAAYIRSREGIPDGSEVVLIRYDKAAELLRDAQAYRMLLDNPFSLAA